MIATKDNLLICIYSSHDDFHLAEKLRQKINKSWVKQTTIIVLTDTNQKKDFRYDTNNDILYLNIKECYTYNCLKTELMFKACHELFNFAHLVKWDASTMVPARCYANDTAGRNLSELKKYKFKNKHYYSHLNCCITAERSKRWYENNKSQFLKIIEAEGRDLNAESLIPEEVSYYRGKFYTISSRFCNYMKSSDKCRSIFQQSFEHNHGSEDIAVGLCFQEFKL